MSDFYKFNINNNVVTSVQEFDDGRWEREGIDADERYEISGSDVIKTEWDDGRQEITTYSDADGDGIYQESGKSYGDSAPASSFSGSNDGDDAFGVTLGSQNAFDEGRYQFQITDGAVTSVLEFDDGRWEREGIDADERYEISGSDVIKTEWDDGRQEITTYSDADGDGIYQESGKSYDDDGAPGVSSSVSGEANSINGLMNSPLNLNEETAIFLSENELTPGLIINFIVQNLDSPETIFQASRDNGVSDGMLADILDDDDRFEGVSGEDVAIFWVENGLMDESSESDADDASSAEIVGVSTAETLEAIVEA